jgi:hypothetical protein
MKRTIIIFSSMKRTIIIFSSKKKRDTKSMGGYDPTPMESRGSRVNVGSV